MKPFVAILALVAVFAVPASAAAPAHPWYPHIRIAREYAKTRHAGRIGFQVKTAQGAWGWHATRTVPSASVLKAMLLVAYLRKSNVRHRALHSSERRVLTPMIRHSSNSAANTALGWVGTSGLRRLARAAHMRHFRPVTPVWGNSRINAEDQARYFYEIDQLMPKRHRGYGMYLLSHVVKSQRWGVGRVHLPSGWKLYFKGGWGSGTGRIDNQVALLTHPKTGTRVSVAVMTYLDGSHAYGKETLRGIFKRLLRGLHP
jgi:beta-lactamase class A